MLIRSIWLSDCKSLSASDNNGGDQITLLTKGNPRRNHIFRYQTSPLDVFDDVDLYEKYKFLRLDILKITDEIL